MPGEEGKLAIISSVIMRRSIDGSGGEGKGGGGRLRRPGWLTLPQPLMSSSRASLVGQALPPLQGEGRGGDGVKWLQAREGVPIPHLTSPLKGEGH